MVGRSQIFLILCFSIFGVLGDFQFTTENKFTQVPYRGKTISIWKRNETYFTFPLGFMGKDSIGYITSNGKPATKILKFDLILTNKEFQRAAVNHLRKLTGDCVQFEDIQLLKIPEIDVVLKSRPENLFHLKKKWNVTMTTNMDALNLKIPCQKSSLNVDVCKMFKSMLASDPLLEMSFAITGTTFKVFVKTFKNLTTSDSVSEEMEKCKTQEQINMENLLSSVKSIGETIKTNFESEYEEHAKMENTTKNLISSVKSIGETIKTNFESEYKEHAKMENTTKNLISSVNSLGQTMQKMVEAMQKMQRETLKIQRRQLGYNSIHLNETMKSTLQAMAPGNWKLCFIASEHRFLASEFHNKCDERGETLVLLQVGDQISGGYTDKSWKSPNGTGISVSSSNSLLFSLNKNEKMMAKDSSKEIVANPNYGPIFDCGNYLVIYNKCNTRTSSYANMGTGHINFKCTEYEVYYKVP